MGRACTRAGHVERLGRLRSCRIGQQQAGDHVESESFGPEHGTGGDAALLSNSLQGTREFFAISTRSMLSSRADVVCAPREPFGAISGDGSRRDGDSRSADIAVRRWISSRSREIRMGCGNVETKVCPKLAIAWQSRGTMQATSPAVTRQGHVTKHPQGAARASPRPAQALVAVRSESLIGPPKGETTHAQRASRVSGTEHDANDPQATRRRAAPAEVTTGDSVTTGAAPRR